MPPAEPLAEQFEAAWRLHQFLAARDVPYALIGGLALQKWGNPRFTLDVDVTVLVDAGQEEPLIRELAKAFRPRIDDAVALALKRRILLLQLPDGANIDVSLALPGYEAEAISRAVEVELERGRPIRVCSAEDLIIHKAVAGRPQDLIDLQTVIEREGRKLDLAYIRKWLRVLAEAAEEPAIVERFEEPWQRVMGRG